jgi:hypothetical protein
MGSTRYTEGATDTWHLGKKADIAKHKKLEPNSGNKSRKACCQKWSTGNRLDLQLCSDEDWDS